MDQAKFTYWLDAYKLAWETRDQEAAANLFTANATYHETPFDEPARGREGILDYWSDVIRTQETIEFSYEVLAVAKPVASPTGTRSLRAYLRDPPSLWTASSW
jgi:hypothetical protein